ncbi:hypothetical protein ACFFV7_00940 [Nonomuraea spiralis]|uniref:Uncharacterized protein n=1 Tax=Nonomuraea spiralis TaxID=46182 RepID=A0ABV5I5C9_9ACTN|nr:hypothetical protein [Nonomuraea spiralis]GGS63301.1 hypothetical protein GCM10010176_001860 [Nonomuraea spiralis]
MNSRTIPGRSSRSRAPLGTGRRVIAPQTTAATPTGTLNQNTHRQPAVPARNPPNDGPTSPATEMTAM